MDKNIRKIGYKFKSVIYRIISTEVSNDYCNTVFLAGTGRSGTTWLSNVINYDNEYRYLFEPFHNQKVKLLKKLEYRQYLNANDTSPVHCYLIKKVLSGRVRNLWTDSHNRKLISRYRLIKDIRANLMLHYIHKRFPGIPIVFVLRHPCAVAYSKLKLNWHTHLNDFLRQDNLIKDHLASYKDYIKEIDKKGSDFEKHIVLWCIENYVPLQQFKRNEIYFVFYENFLLHPEKEIPRLFNYLGKESEEKMYRVLNIPSQVTRNESSIRKDNKDVMIKAWKSNLTDNQIERAYEILKDFGLENLYDVSSLGNYNELERCLTKNQ